MDSLLTDAHTPKHVRVREYVRRLIENSEPGAPAPSERELVNRFGVARMTVRQALEALVAEGLLERMPGRGTFVSGPVFGSRRPLSFTEEMSRRRLVAESQTLVSSCDAAPAGLARILGVTVGERVVHWRRLRHVDNEPLCLQDCYFAESRLPGFDHSAPPVSLYEAFAERGIRPTRAEDVTAAKAASVEEAGHLGIAVGAPVLRITRRAFAGEEILETSRSIFRADRFQNQAVVGSHG